MHNFRQRQREPVSVGVWRELDLHKAIARHNHALIDRVEQLGARRVCESRRSESRARFRR